SRFRLSVNELFELLCIPYGENKRGLAMFLLICIPYGKLLRFGISKADIKSNRHFGMHPK
ncbi:MAG: hypothetical protein LBG15_15380, partial [Dysgonamonadaceae bacterium]|nr:hypothetical protein [Dysgonamonadaceae bacterium]